LPKPALSSAVSPKCWKKRNGRDFLERQGQPMTAMLAKGSKKQVLFGEIFGGLARN
jgi:hypothetical protein